MLILFSEQACVLFLLYRRNFYVKCYSVSYKQVLDTEPKLLCLQDFPHIETISLRAHVAQVPV